MPAWLRDQVLRGTTNLGATLLGFLHQLNPAHSEAPRPGYVFTLRRVVHYCRLTDAPWARSRSLP
jgi:hypothetical protein